MTGFSRGWDCAGDGESFPGTTVQATPGERRIVNLFTSSGLPGGAEPVGLCRPVRPDLLVDKRRQHRHFDRFGLGAELNRDPIDLIIEPRRPERDIRLGTPASTGRGLSLTLKYVAEKLIFEGIVG